MQIMMDVAASGTMLPFGDTVLTAVLGYAVVFMGLLVLMAIVYIMGAVFKSMAARKAALAEAARNAKAMPKAANAPAAPAKEPKKPVAPGTAGEVKRFDVPDKEAAMIMAIVADQMGKPLNELRFKSIKEVK